MHTFTNYIRIMSNTDEYSSVEGTVELVKRLQDSGVSAIAIHCRKPSDRTSVKPDYSIIGEILKVAKVPISINGGLNSLEDANMIEKVHGGYYLLTCPIFYHLRI